MIHIQEELEHEKPTEKEVEDLAKLICFMDKEEIDYKLEMPMNKPIIEKGENNGKENNIN